MDDIQTEEAKPKITSWLVRCTAEQKEQLQRVCSEFDKPTATLLIDSLQAMNSQSLLANSSDETQKDFAEMNKLIARLTQMVSAKMCVIVEKEKMADEQKTLLAAKEAELENQFETLKNELMSEVQIEKELLSKSFHSQLEAEKSKFSLEISIKDTIISEATFREEEYNERIRFLEEKVDNLNHQLNQSYRNYDLLDEKCLDLGMKLKAYETSMVELEKLKLAFSQKCNEFSELELKYRGLAKEEELKRQYLEKELRMQFEFEMNKNVQRRPDVEVQ